MFDRVGFFFALAILNSAVLATNALWQEATAMLFDDRDAAIEFSVQRTEDSPKSSVSRRIARAIVGFIYQRTGHAPGSADAVQTDDGFEVTLRRSSALIGDGRPHTAKETLALHEKFRALLAESSVWLRQEVRRITGSRLRTVTAAVGVATVTVVIVLENNQEDTGK